MNYNEAKELFSKIEIDINEEQFNNLNIYEELLLEWNKKINLTAITKDYEIWLKHFVDSCTISHYIKPNYSVIDVGTGAGFPSVPVKVINENISLTLLDSLNKRINFLSEICEKLKLKDIKFVHKRAEDAGKEIEFREKYDVATARAVANLATLAEYCMPFVKVNGYFICMKAGNIDEELKQAQEAIKKLGGIVESVEKLVLPDSDIERTIIIIKKTKNTPKKYPRKAGEPQKSPIK